ncbi:ADP-ribosylation factor-like protein 13B [Sorochytrium milnesiophthora]
MRPTWGFVNAFVQFGKSVLRIYDVGGNINIRGIWKNYIAECHGMMFVVDGADPNTLDEARAELHNLYSQPRCRGKPLLIVLTRADSSAYLGYDELIKRLDISSLRTQAVAEHQTIGLTSVNVCECDCTIYSVIGKRIDPRINNGVARLVETIELNRVYIEDRIRHDTAVQKQEYLDEQQQKRQRVDQYKSAPLN